MEITGVVHEIGKTQQVTDSFKKRDLILKCAENPKFEEYIKFEAAQDKVSLFDKLAVGEEVEVSFNLRGRPYTDKKGVTTYFNSLVAWRVNKSEFVGSSQHEDNVFSVNNEESDLPF